jgi:hypothetical protein
MGWSYRRSIRIGPARINVGSRGVGYSIGGKGFRSIGGKGFRTGVRSDGRRYTRVTVPGSGFSYTTASSGPMGAAASHGCAVLVAVILVPMVLLLL